MELLLALLYGTGLGMLALFPGFHFAMLLMTAGPWMLSRFSLAYGLVAMEWSVVIARSMHTLAVVYHPISGDQIASAKPAQRLAMSGQGIFATALMGDALKLGTLCTVITMLLLLGLGNFLHLNLVKSLLQSCMWLALPAFLGWAGFTAWIAQCKWETLAVMLASGILGVVALQHPAVQGASHAMTPLLTGLFGFPVLLLALFEQHRGAHKPLPKIVERETPAELKYFGLGMGLFSVLLPGLGISSLVSTGQTLVEDDSQYLTMACIAEDYGELLALVIGILGCGMRSSDAAVILRVVQTHNPNGFTLGPVFPYLLLAALLAAMVVGLLLVRVLGFPYRFLMLVIPTKLQALLVACGMLWVVWSHTQVWGLMILSVGTLIHLGARQLGTPNQAFFACLVAPMALTLLGVHLF